MTTTKGRRDRFGVHDYLRRPLRSEDPAIALRNALAATAGLDAPRDSDANRLVSELLLSVHRRLRCAFPRTAEHEFADAVTDGIIEYLPLHSAEVISDSFVTARVYQAAWRNVANALNSGERRKLREDQWAKMCEWQASGVSEPDAIASDELWPRLTALASDETDLRGLRRWLDGAPAEAIADALGCSNLTIPQQRAEVKRFKDRIKRRSRRLLCVEPSRP